jgi:uncharacterized phage protein gp47/JayE
MSDTIAPAYGVLPTGFSRMRLPEIRQEIINTLQERTGLTFETRPDSITGQFINVFAEREATLWELAEAVYHAMYPISATGVNLDHSVSFAGVRRLFAERSNVWCACYGTEATIIPAGSIIRSSLTQDNFLLDAEVTITRQATIDTTVEIASAIEGQEYWIRIDQSLYRYFAVAGDTNVSIATSLAALLLASNLTIALDGHMIRIYGTESIPFMLQTSTNINLFIISSLGVFTAENYGPSSVEVDTVNQIVTTMHGWDSVNNYVSGHLGRNLETDDELRLRYDKGVFRLGAATLESIRANIQQNVAGLTAVQVYENEDDVVDAEGRPPHSIEVIVAGGDPQDIADQIYLLKAAGIDTFGDILVYVTGSSGYQHPIYFNRPLPIYIWVDVTVTLYNEEQFPDNGVRLIQLMVTNTGNNFGIGKDVIIQRFHGPIYSNVPGIGQLDIKVAQAIDVNSVPPVESYVTTNIPISARELATFDVTKVMVTILDARRANAR